MVLIIRFRSDVVDRKSRDLLIKMSKPVKPHTDVNQNGGMYYSNRSSRPSGPARVRSGWHRFPAGSIVTKKEDAMTVSWPPALPMVNARPAEVEMHE